MFAPNRLITPKEQALLLTVVAAVVMGSLALWFRPKAEAVIPGEALVQEGRSQSTVLPAQTTLPPVLPVQVVLEDRQVSDPPDSTERTGVGIMGAVRRPGLYFMLEDARVMDLVEKAGGFLDTADASDIQLTAPLLDETTLFVPHGPEFERGDSKIVHRRSHGPADLNPLPYRRRKPSGFYQEPQDTLPRDRQPFPSNPASSSHRINVNEATEEQLQELPGIGTVLARAIVATRRQQPFVSVDDLMRVPGIGDKRLEAIRHLVVAP